MIRRSGIFERKRMKKFDSVSDAGLTDQNFWGTGADGTMVVSSDATWDSGSSGDMIVKNLTDFTVNSGITLTIKARKGCLIYVSGNCVINGTIWIKSGYACNPSDAGVPSDGLVIARRKTGSTESGSSILTGCGTIAINSEAGQTALSANGKKYTIPRTGASGGASKTNGAGNPGTAGSGIQTGGGGGGGARSASSGSGAAGTCFSGGGGGAGSNTVTSGSATPYGGRGGNATDGAAGGAGNPGGSAGGSYAYAGSDGIGGLLVLFVKGNLTVASGAYIKANGAKGGNINDNLVGSGGGSGGGIIIVLYAGILSNSGTVQALGGAGGDPIGYSNPNLGGAGGAGTTLIEQILR